MVDLLQNAAINYNVMDGLGNQPSTFDVNFNQVETYMNKYIVIKGNPDIYNNINCENSVCTKPSLKNNENSDSNIDMKELATQLTPKLRNHGKPKTGKTVTPKQHVVETDRDAYINVRWSSLVRQQKKINNEFKMGDTREPTDVEKFYSNYHNNIGIPSAKKLVAELKLKNKGFKSKSKLNKKTKTPLDFRIVNGNTIPVGLFPYLVRLIIL